MQRYEVFIPIDYFMSLIALLKTMALIISY